LLPAFHDIGEPIMSVRYSDEQKAAARALLDFQAPTQTLVAACMGTTERSMTEWVAKFGWTFVDFRNVEAREKQARHRRAMLRGLGRNVPAQLRKLDYFEAVRQDELEAEEEQHDSASADTDDAGAPAEPAAPVERLSPGERAERLSELLLANADMVIAAAQRQGGVLSRPQVDTLLTMLRLAEKLEPLMEERAREQANKNDDEIAELYDRVDRLIHRRAFSYGSQLIEREARPCESCGAKVVPVEVAAQLKQKASEIEIPNPNRPG
jgi:hypothetical protein